jgi:hypothetical protein
MRAYPVPGSWAWGALIGVWIIVSGPPSAVAGGGDETFSPATRALPGTWRIGAATAHAPGVALSAASGYGYTEAVLGQDDTHHRARAGLALSYRPNSWLGFAAAFDARYDRHLGDGIDDGGYVGDPRLTARVLRLGTGDLTFGAEATLWLPGESAPSIVASAATLDAIGLATYAPPALRRHAIHVNAGVRVDQSAASAPAADRLSLAQRLALGVSDSHALLVGAGWSASLAPGTVFAEWSWDVLIGADAPAPHRSPMRMSAGLYRRVGDRTRLFGVGEVSLSARPGLERSDPLVPVEPRASFIAGVSYQLRGPGAGAHAELDAQLGSIAGRVASPEGEPIAGARLRIRARGVDKAVTTAEDGSFRAGGIPVGQAGIVARASGYREHTLAVEVVAQTAADVSIALEHDLPDGQLKGVVLSFDGHPIAAAIRVEPIGVNTSAGDDGSFELDLPPGEYEVSISAPGHRDQVRTLTVERRGVTVLNIDMRRER